jgi:hypothetical protein
MLDGFSAEAINRGLDRLLDRRMILLALPAGIAGAVILYVEAVARHQPITVPGATGIPRRNSCGRQRLAAGLLQPQNPHRALAAGDGQAVIQHGAGG